MPIPKSFTDIYFKQWIDLHPDYTPRIWTEEDLVKDDFNNAHIILDTSLNPGLRADALRLEILSKYGGIYVDIDMACLQSITGFLTKF